MFSLAKIFYMRYKYLLKISNLHVVLLVGMPSSPKSSQEKTMRKTFEPQITFGTVSMSNIKFDIFCRHELVPNFNDATASVF